MSCSTDGEPYPVAYWQVLRLAHPPDIARAAIIATALNDANARYLSENKSPSRKVNEHDNRGSHYYVAAYWAEALANQDQDEDLAKRFRSVADELADSEENINAELIAAQGDAVDIGGYYHPDADLAAAAMRPSNTLNHIIDSI